MRLLVVEDEPELNHLLVKQLQAAHYSVDSCLNGTDALDYLCCAEYDAIVLRTCCQSMAEGSGTRGSKAKMLVPC
ncbi:MAG: hypothetical protein ACLS8R_06475 [Anaeromassilibacillus sp.]